VFKDVRPTIADLRDGGEADQECEFVRLRSQMNVSRARVLRHVLLEDGLEHGERVVAELSEHLGWSFWKRFGGFGAGISRPDSCRWRARKHRDQRGGVFMTPTHGGVVPYWAARHDSPRLGISNASGLSRCRGVLLAESVHMVG